MNDLSKAGVVVLENNARSAEQMFGKQLLEVISAHHNGSTNYSHIGTLNAERWASLKTDLYLASPRLEEFVAQLQETMRKSCGVFLPELGIGHFSENERASFAYALAVCLGNPTATNKKQVVWDVKARAASHSTYRSTFSETDDEAKYHTDTQYFPEPEPLFCLYVMEEARCGGGYSSLLDARRLRSDIERHRPDLAEFLSSHHLPFMVPSAFASNDDPDYVEATLAPIFDDHPSIRYRKDTLDHGIDAFAEFKTRSVIQALTSLEDELAECDHKAEFFMPRDSLVLINNHQALHARTAFQDHQRHLLRIRMHNASTPKTKKYKMLQRLKTPSQPVNA